MKYKGRVIKKIILDELKAIFIKKKGGEKNEGNLVSEGRTKWTESNPTTLWTLFTFGWM